MSDQFQFYSKPRSAHLHSSKTRQLKQNPTNLGQSKDPTELPANFTMRCMAKYSSLSSWKPTNQLIGLVWLFASLFVVCVCLVFGFVCAVDFLLGGSAQSRSNQSETLEVPSKTKGIPRPQEGPAFNIVCFILSKPTPACKLLKNHRPHSEGPSMSALEPFPS